MLHWNDYVIVVYFLVDLYGAIDQLRPAVYTSVTPVEPCSPPTIQSEDCRVKVKITKVFALRKNNILTLYSQFLTLFFSKNFFIISAHSSFRMPLLNSILWLSFLLFTTLKMLLHAPAFLSSAP